MDTISRLVNRLFFINGEPRRHKIIDLYILKEILVPTGIGMGIFTVIFLVSKLFRVKEMVVDKGVPLGYAIELFLCLIPAFLVFVARGGYLTPEPEAQKLVLNLFDGSIHSQEARGETYCTINFNTYQFTIFQQDEIEKERKKARVKMLEAEMSINDLREKIKGLKYEVTSMGTEVEGKVEELLSLAYPLQKGPSGCSPPSGLTNAGTKKCG